MAEEKKERGMLSKTFWFAAKAVCISLPLAVAGQMWLDPGFLLAFHNPLNLMGQAWVMKMNSLFGWIPQTVGLAEKPGLLTPLMKSFLAKELAILTPSTTLDNVDNIMNDFPGGLGPASMFAPA